MPRATHACSEWRYWYGNLPQFGATPWIPRNQGNWKFFQECLRLKSWFFWEFFWFHSFGPHGSGVFKASQITHSPCKCERSFLSYRILLFQISVLVLLDNLQRSFCSLRNRLKIWGRWQCMLLPYWFCLPFNRSCTYQLSETHIIFKGLSQNLSKAFRYRKYQRVYLLFLWCLNVIFLLHISQLDHSLKHVLHKLHTNFSRILHKTKSCSTKNKAAYLHRIMKVFYHPKVSPLGPSFVKRLTPSSNQGVQEQDTSLGRLLFLESVSSSKKLSLI